MKFISLREFAIFHVWKSGLILFYSNRKPVPIRNVRLVDKKNWDTQNFLHLYQAFNCQEKVKIKLTFTITVDSYLVNCIAESNWILKIPN
jgi:hypothetical protein